MAKDLVIGLDSSTTSTKAIAWANRGVAVAEGRSPIALTSPAPDWYEQNAEDWWNSACAALRDLLAQVSPERIAALGISTQRETFVPLAADGSPIRPAIVWLDQRCRQEVGWLSGRVGRRRIHQISGKPVDMAPVAYRMAWMLRNEPEHYRRTAFFADVHGYLTRRLTGEFRTSWTSADPLGLFDLLKKDWSEEILKALQVAPERLPVAMAPGSVLGQVNESAAQSTWLPAGTPVIAGGGDGQLAGLGECTDTQPRVLEFGNGGGSGHSIGPVSHRPGVAHDGQCLRRRILSGDEFAHLDIPDRLVSGELRGWSSRRGAPKAGIRGRSAAGGQRRSARGALSGRGDDAVLGSECTRLPGGADGSASHGLYIARCWKELLWNRRW